MELLTPYKFILTIFIFQILNQISYLSSVAVRYYSESVTKNNALWSERCSKKAKWHRIYLYVVRAATRFFIIF